ncbi:MAG: triose-phosphate isomerase [Christensenellales bacterium]|jgi:triosephosphate isomerase
MRKPIIAGNWKMNKTPAEAVAFVKELIPLVKDAKCDVVICPPDVCLSSVKELLIGTNIEIGAQNCHYMESGAYTGETSPTTLAAMGIQYVIIGHSERRQYFGETNETVNLRAKAAIRAGLTPIICVGETLEQREAGVTEPLIRYQVAQALVGVTSEEVKGVVIAYEPVWAIGTGKTATAEQANEVNALIRNQIAMMYGWETANDVRVQYGGSMNPKNCYELMEQPDIDGGLIGGASLKAQDFSAVVHY